MISASASKRTPRRFGWSPAAGVLLLLLLLLFFATGVQGQAPASDASYHDPKGTATSQESSINLFDTDDQGRAVFGARKVASGDTVLDIHVVTRQGLNQAGRTISGSPDDYIGTGLRFSWESEVLASYHIDSSVGPSFDQVIVEKLDPTTLLNIPGTVQIDVMSGQWASPAMGSSARVVAGIPGGDVVVCDVTNDRLARFNLTDPGTQVWNVAVIDCATARYEADNNWLVIHRGTQCDTVERHSVSTGTIIGTAKTSGPSTGVCNARPHQSNVAADRTVVAVRKQSTTAAGTFTINWTSGATSEVDFGKPSATNVIVAAAVPDAFDDILFCGETASGSFVSRGVASGPSYDWSIFTSDKLRQCEFDHVNGFWVYGEYVGNGTVFVRHYSGGNFTSPPLRGMTPFVPASPVLPPGLPIAAAKTFFEESWGISEEVGNWLFGMAIVGIVSVAFWRIGESPLLTTVGLFLGVGIAFAFGFLPLWFLLLLVFIVIGVVGMRLFGDSDGGDAA